MVAGGIVDSLKNPRVVVRSNAELLAMGSFKKGVVNWKQLAVTGFDPANNSLTLSDGSTATYDVLVVNPGLQLRFDQIQGAQAALDDPSAPVGSMYTL